MKNLKKISRTDLSKVVGGRLDGCSYKCCSDSNPQSCSETVTFTVEQSGSASCSSGSHLVSA